MIKKHKIRILIDANPLVGKKSGVGHFTYRLIESLARQSDYTEITAYYFNFLGLKKVPDLPAQDAVTYKEVRFVPTRLINLLHRLGLQIPLELFIGFKRYSFMIFPNFVAIPSLYKTPFATVIHDLGFIDCPEYVADGNRKYLERFVKKTIKNCSFVLTISEFTKKRISSIYGIKDSNILVLPIPYEPKETNKSDLVSQEVKQLTDKPIILFVGNIEPRKNIDGLINAFAKTSKATQIKYRLVLAGGWGWKTENIQEALNLHGNKLDIKVTGYVSDSERDYLYRKAALVCIPSHYEGFGMQIMEALYYKKNLLVSPIPPFKEITSESISYIGDLRPAQFANDIDKALTKRTPKNVIMPSWSWEENSQQLLNKIFSSF